MPLTDRAFDSIIKVHRLQQALNNQAEEKEKLYEGLLIILFTAIGCVILFLVASRKINNEKRKRRSFDFDYTKERIAEVIINLGLNVCNLDEKKFGAKLLYLKSFIIRYFPYEADNIQKYFDNYKEEPLKTRDILKWINKHEKNPERKSTILYLVTEIASADGEITGKELSYIEKICEELNLDKKRLDSFRAMFHKDNKTFEEKKVKQRPIISERKRFLIVLELEENANEDAVKKAYRKFAKQFHPDKLINAPEVDREIATERFHKIQEAYDYLTK